MGPPWSLLDHCPNQDPAGEGYLRFQQDYQHPWQPAPVCAPHAKSSRRAWWQTGKHIHPLHPGATPKVRETCTVRKWATHNNGAATPLF